MGLLAEQPVHLLFVVIATGYVLGRVRIGGFSLGVAAVLFAGIAFSAFDHDLKLPEVVYTFGLAVFVYATGLAGGPVFVSALKRRGLRVNALVLGVLLAAAAVACGAAFVLDLPGGKAAGLFAGCMTNTPALAAVIETLKQSGATDDELAMPVVAYSLTYPLGVIGVLLAAHVVQRFFKVDFVEEAALTPEIASAAEPVSQQTIRVTNDYPLTVDELLRAKGWAVRLGRLKRDGHTGVVHTSTVLRRDDIVSLVGNESELDEAIAALGERVESQLPGEQSELERRRVFLSNADLVGQRVSDLELPTRFGATITRIRRGDVDLVGSDDVVLELGDRLRVVAPAERMKDVEKLLGDSYRALGEVDVMTFSIGIALGLLLGALKFPLPGGSHLSLGFAGGPLLMGLILGAVHRTGPLVWQIPYTANITLRQFGTVLFLAGIGLRAGPAFADTVTDPGSAWIILAGVCTTVFATTAMLVIGYRWLRVPMSLLLGALAGQQTQPAVLAFAHERVRNEVPNLGYSTVYPLAMVTKILLAQVLLTVLT